MPSHSRTGGVVVAACSSSAVCCPPPPPPPAPHAASPQGAGGDSWLPRTSADGLSSTASVFTCIPATSAPPPCGFASMADGGGASSVQSAQIAVEEKVFQMAALSSGTSDADFQGGAAVRRLRSGRHFGTAEALCSLRFRTCPGMLFCFCFVCFFCRWGLLGAAGKWLRCPPLLS